MLQKHHNKLAAAVLLLFACLCVISTAISAERVELCACSKADGCTTQAYGQVRECKKQCAPKLKSYKNEKGNITEESLVSCFADPQIDPHMFSSCMQKQMKNTCHRVDSSSSSTSNEGEAEFVDDPDYSSFYEPIIEYTDDQGTTLKGSRFLKKSRKAFAIFRSFQGCLKNCLKQKAIQCFEQNRCAVSFKIDAPAETAAAAVAGDGDDGTIGNGNGNGGDVVVQMKTKKADADVRSIFNECSKLNAHKSARDACVCLIKRFKVQQLIGICPLFLNTHLMRID